MITKSEVKALNNSVKIKLDGEWVYTELDNVEIGGIPLKDFIKTVEHKIVDTVQPIESHLSNEITRLENELNALRTAFEDTLKGMMTR